MTNLQIAELLRNVASAYKLKDEKKNFFKITAYERAADAVEHASSELKDLWDEGKLTDVPGVGPSIAEHLDELFRTGKSKHFDEIMAGIPFEAFKLTELPGIGIKTAMKMMKNGMKKEVDEKLKEVAEREKKGKRHLLPYAATVAGLIIEWMKKDPNIKQIDTLGSLRRQASTIGDIDISVGTDKPSEVLDHFAKYPDRQKVIEKGPVSSSIIVPGNLQVDLMALPSESYGSLLQHFTGSKHHNIALREYALKKGLSLSERGIKNVKTGKVVKFSNETDFYRYLGLTYIPPELREDEGEIEAAREGNLPKLVELGDIKSDLQIHSSFDIETSHDLGESSMEELIEKGNELKYEYMAFTEHNPSQSGHNDNEVTEILKRKKENVEQLNYSLKSKNNFSVKKVFNSLEVDILPDGRIPVSEKALELTDFVLVSIHSSFQLDRKSMTKRVLEALSYPKAKIFAHPTARKLNEREGVELNWPEIFDFCLRKKKWIEVNADPMRLDLPDNLVHEAVKLGVKLTLGTDAHHVDGMNNMIFGVSVARRGWAKKNDIINTLKLSEFETFVKEGE